MANVIELHSLDAPELAVFARLTDRQLRSRAEELFALFLS